MADWVRHVLLFKLNYAAGSLADELWQQHSWIEKKKKKQPILGIKTRQLVDYDISKINTYLYDSKHVAISMSHKANGP